MAKFPAVGYFLSPALPVSPDRIPESISNIFYTIKEFKPDTVLCNSFLDCVFAFNVFFGSFRAIQDCNDVLGFFGV